MNLLNFEHDKELKLLELHKSNPGSLSQEQKERAEKINEYKERNIAKQVEIRAKNKGKQLESIKLLEQSQPVKSAYISLDN